jgi:SP family general alpha glucoside:H+ symporter-like MFS transporter
MSKSPEPNVQQQPVATQGQLLAHAEDANTKEHVLTLRSALKLYPKAISWSILMSTALVMDGYDFKLIGSLFAQPAFAKAYGVLQSDGTYQIPAAWQTGLNNGSNVGQMIGLLIAGYIVERFGFRRTMMGALVVVPCIIFIQFFANELPQLEAGQVLLGIPLGIFQTVTCVYAIEVMPVCLRAYLTSYISGCWLIGQLIAAGTLRGTLNMTSSWAYRIPFAVQSVQCPLVQRSFTNDYQMVLASPAVRRSVPGARVSLVACSSKSNRRSSSLSSPPYVIGSRPEFRC